MFTAVKALIRIGYPRSVEFLIRILLARKPFVRATAAKVLEELGDVRAIERSSSVKITRYFFMAEHQRKALS